MVTYSSKKTSNSYVFYSFCCSAPTEITHSHQVGIQSSSPLAKRWYLIDQHPSPQGTRGIEDIWAPLSGPYSQPYKGPVMSSQLPTSFPKSGFCLHSSVQTHPTFCSTNKFAKPVKNPWWGQISKSLCSFNLINKLCSSKLSRGTISNHT